MVGTATQALAVAESTVGRRESPPGSNICPPFTDPIPGQPWCAAWCDWVLRQVGWTLRTITPNPYYVPAIVAGAKRAGTWFPASQARPGDLVCFDWRGDGVSDHIGIAVVNRPASADMLTIEGNTGVGNDSNGGEVMRRTRKWSQVSGVVRPPYAAAPAPPPPPPPRPTTPGDDMPLTDQEIERIAARVRDYLASPTANPGTIIDPGARSAIAQTQSAVSDPKFGIGALLARVIAKLGA